MTFRVSALLLAFCLDLAIGGTFFLDTFFEVEELSAAAVFFLAVVEDTSSCVASVLPEVPRAALPVSFFDALLAVAEPAAAPLADLAAVFFAAALLCGTFLAAVLAVFFATAVAAFLAAGFFAAAFFVTFFAVFLPAAAFAVALPDVFVATWAPVFLLATLLVADLPDADALFAADFPAAVFFAAGARVSLRAATFFAAAFLLALALLGAFLLDVLLSAEVGKSVFSLVALLGS